MLVRDGQNFPAYKDPSKPTEEQADEFYESQGSSFVEFGGSPTRSPQIGAGISTALYGVALLGLAASAFYSKTVFKFERLN